MEKEVQKITEENTSLKIRIEQLEDSDFMRNQDTVKLIQKNEKLENNVKYLVGKTTHLENRSRRGNLKIIGLSESHDQKKSLDIVFQEIIQENCPDISEPESYTKCVPFPKNFMSVAKTILKRLFRVYAHIYHQHFDPVIQLQEEAHLNTSFKHFIFFVQVS
uniref:Uncharacterized protein n=1 Tax=Vombatus ursinus TaxID=29139 RepID=A0A4X2KJ19_VOMUR